MTIYLFLIGCAWVMLGTVIKTEDFISSVVFKVLPIASGGFAMYYAATLLNWV